MSYPIVICSRKFNRLPLINSNVTNYPIRDIQINNICMFLIQMLYLYGGLFNCTVI